MMAQVRGSSTYFEGDMMRYKKLHGGTTGKVMGSLKSGFILWEP